MKAAVLCASGIGDGLLMMICACQLKRAGYEVTVYHPDHPSLSPLFPTHAFAGYPELPSFEKEFAPFNLTILENDNSARAWELFRLREEGKMPYLRSFFPTPCKAFRKGDVQFNKHFPAATNIATATQYLLGLSKPKRDNDLLIPKAKNFKKYPERVLIHPTSRDPKRNWRQKQFVALAKRLKSAGYEPTFSVSPEDWDAWAFVENEGFSLAKNRSLIELSEYIYESGFLIGNDSGLGHLASNLGVPTLTISGNRKRVKLWRPNWTYGEIVTPQFSLPNFKGIGFRFREWFWQHFVSVNRVWKCFKRLTAHES